MLIYLAIGGAIAAVVVFGWMVTDIQQARARRRRLESPKVIDLSVERDRRRGGR